MKHTISTALQYRWLGTQWILNDEYSIEWLSTDVAKPTMEELQTAIAELDASEAMRLLREKRYTMLTATDVYALPDFPHGSDEKRAEWMAYRQNLRDLPNNSTPTLNADFELDMASVTWPVRPV